MKTGIAIAGSILVDKINEISAYPSAGELTKIISLQKAVGGCVPNVAIDIKRMCPDLTVKAVGRVGADEEGEYVKTVLSDFGVETADVIVAEEKTSFTEVMSVTSGQRTFFTYAGASAEFGADDVDLDKLGAKILHLGYFLLLDKIDGGDGLSLLKAAKEKGIITSIDLVSENSDRYSIVIPCLPYVDNLIINETEAGGLTGITPTRDNLEEIAKKLMSYGVRERVIIHTPELGLCVSKNGTTVVPSYDMPRSFIVGTTGAGDAFCAGALIGIYREKTDAEILDLASAAAVAALSGADATSGMRTEAEIMELCAAFGRTKL